VLDVGCWVLVKELGGFGTRPYKYIFASPLLSEKLSYKITDFENKTLETSEPLESFESPESPESCI